MSFDIIMDALIDTGKLLPFLVVIYFLVSLLEYRLGDRMGSIVMRFAGWAPVLGALLGCLPQCGFSVVAATLYTKRLISIGALIAVFISTSDEAVPVLLSMPDQSATVIRLVVIKVVIAIIAGLVIDLIIKRPVVGAVVTASGDDLAAAGRHQGCCAHDLCATKFRLRSLLWHPLKHALKIAVFLFLFSVLLSFVLQIIGEARLSAVLLHDHILQPALAGLIGLVPNCFTSVFLAELYSKGAVSFGALVAGLSSAAGLGLLVLFKENKSVKDSLVVLGLLLGVSILAGTLLVGLKIY